GAPPGVNYYNIVQPQVQAQTAIAQLQQQVQTQVLATSVGPGSGLSTGHPVFFGNYYHYYSTRGLAGIGTTLGGGAATLGAQIGTGAVGRTSQGTAAPPNFPGTGTVR